MVTEESIDKGLEALLTSYEKASGSSSIVVNAGIENMMKNITKQVWESLIMKDLVGVQPAPEPKSKVYFLKYVTEEGEPLDVCADWDPETTKVMFEVRSEDIEAKTLKLSTGWTIEAKQDLEIYHDFDIEREITQMISNEVVTEIQEHIISDLKHIATKTTVDSQCSQENLSLLININREANKIAQETRRGAGNWCVVSNGILANLIKSKDFQRTSEPKGFGTNLLYVGTVNGHSKVYLNRYINNNEMLIGYKGSSDTDTDYIYSPYVLALASGVVINPITFQPVMSLVTRGSHLIPSAINCKDFEQSHYYRLVTFNGLPIEPTKEDETAVKEFTDELFLGENKTVWGK